MVDVFLYPCFISEDDGVFYADFPDFEACFTDGDSLEEVLFNAKDVLTAVLVDMASSGVDFPLASRGISSDDGFVVYVDVLKSLVFSRVANQSVKKTLTIPKWLNDVAVSRGVNFSGILQSALKEELNL